MRISDPGPEECASGPKAGEGCSNDGNCGDQLCDSADNRRVKAGWNWNLTNNDSSRGVHNPDFTF